MQSDKIISQLFVRLNSAYGNLFSSRYKTDQMLQAAKREWAIDLHDVTPEVIGLALRTCKRRHVDMPPTLPQFVQLCREVARVPAGNPKRLPRSSGSRETAARFITELRASFPWLRISNAR